MTVRMALVRAHVRRLNRSRHDLAAMDRAMAARSEPAPVPPEVGAWCEWSAREVGGRTVVTLTPRGARSGVHVLHAHGGAFVYSIRGEHWTSLARLAAASGAVIHVPLYGVAPASGVDQAHAFVDAVHRDVLAAAARDGAAPLVVLSGDSAGGGLALGQAMRARDSGLPQPLAVLLFSPWLDLAVPPRADHRLERRDPMLSAVALRRAGRMWAGARDLADPLVSPLYGDLVGLPAVTTLVGGRDLLVEDAERLHRGIGAAGGATRLRVWPSGFHVFMAASSTREAREAMAEAAAVLRPSPARA